MKTTMAILSSFMLILLTCCQFRQKNLDKSLTDSYSFEFNEKCPHMCWLGINPGRTTAEEAKGILRASNQINEKWLLISETGIQTEWTPDKKGIPYNIGITFENGLVKTVSMSLSPLMVNDYINLIGEPDQISISLEEGIEYDFIEYMLYYSSRKIAIFVLPGTRNGPQPDDKILILALNIYIDELDTSNWLARKNNDLQTWLGYGHLSDYLPTLPAITFSPTP